MNIAFFLCFSCSIPKKPLYLQNKKFKTYNIKFSHKTLKSTIENKRKVDWYGEIEINGVLTKLHWEYC